MKDRALIEKSIIPTEIAIEEVLHDSYKYYKSLIKMAEKFDSKWVFYKGWSQKIFDKKKALFYIVPYYNSFIVSMAIRENEREELMMNTMLFYAHDMLRESEKYNEGYAVQFMVEDDKSWQGCEKLVDALIGVRTTK